MLVLASASPRRRELLAQAGFTFKVCPAHIPEEAKPGEAPTAYVIRLAREKAEAVFRHLTQAREGAVSGLRTLEAAEKGWIQAKMPGEHTAGAKAGVGFAALTARLKSCPDAYGGSGKSFPAACSVPKEALSEISPASENPPAVQTSDALTVLGADTTVTLDNHILGKPEDAADAARMLRLLSGRTHRVITGIALVTAARTEVACETTAVEFLTLREEEIDTYIATGEPMDKAGAYAIQGRAARWIPRIEGCYFNVVGLPIALVSNLLEACSKPAIR